MEIRTSMALNRVAALLDKGLAVLRTDPDMAQHLVGNAAQIVQGLRETEARHEHA